MMIKSFRKIVRELQKMTAFPNIQKCTTKPWKTTEKVPAESAVRHREARKMQSILKQWGK